MFAPVDAAPAPSRKEGSMVAPPGPKVDRLVNNVRDSILVIPLGNLSRPNTAGLGISSPPVRVPAPDILEPVTFVVKVKLLPEVPGSVASKRVIAPGSGMAAMSGFASVPVP